MNKKTIAIHHGYNKDSNMTMAVPIYQSTAYEFESAEQAANRFCLKELGNIYTRLANPTSNVLEERIAHLEGGVAGIATASGQAAIFYSLANVAEAGDNILISNKLYGGSITLTTYTMKRFGITAKIFDVDNPESLEALVDDKTKAIFFESISNPQITIADVDGIVEIAKKHKILTICDNTVASPALFNPISHGVDIVVHSASKYISGQGLAIGGVIVERDGLTDFFKGNDRYYHFNEPDVSYHGLVYTDIPLPPFCLRLRLNLLRDIGAAPSPFNSWLLIQSLETLSIRMKEHSKNALEVARFLKSHKKVKNVSYPGLESDPQHERAKKYFTDGQVSGLINFDVEDFEEAKELMDKTELFSIVVNIGDSKSLIVHPASTTHQQIPANEQLKSGIRPGMIRLSIGLEDSADLIADLEKALG
ncbi:O-acetylhomoserine aminocarboxypropyltransferase/cysteine synthase family protein [Sulfurimonas sp.]|uniref:O-acetylhomoserine aminocarboxypropyltransferase/cysteine synthase family protein n=1 Tax=Sulfurimonas sp. TaxID=2022749 RepID=UPI0026194E78|nr:O-acetylhomoserine aminocarboxypropyltransferase/cysteine synthase family protein [Sulfurimonas sp.]MCW8896361.1 O-acetylhomoserine aminocarboxypropyltransferase/cysteine synthase [Sulfurimonas sp.]MCW9068322.1 O-acetylhomoserine aminocarboxypropyltransferase/cysteine synthase [Sulfurimonas sp.]